MLFAITADALMSARVRAGTQRKSALRAIARLSTFNRHARPLRLMSLHDMIFCVATPFFHTLLLMLRSASCAGYYYTLFALFAFFASAIER